MTIRSLSGDAMLVNENFEERWMNLFLRKRNLSIFPSSYWGFLGDE